MNYCIAPLAIEQGSCLLNFNRRGRSADCPLCPLSIAALVIYAWLFGLAIKWRELGAAFIVGLGLPVSSIA